MESERKISLSVWITFTAWFDQFIQYYLINLFNYFLYIWYFLTLCFRGKQSEAFLSHISYGGSSPSPPFLRHPTQLAPPRILKSLFLLPSVLFHPLKVFQTIPPTFTQTPPALTWCTNLPYKYIMGLNKYQKGGFTSSTVAFYQKSVFDFLNPFTNISGCLILWDIFRFIFRQTRITFFIKLWRQQKKFFYPFETKVSLMLRQFIWFAWPIMQIWESADIFVFT